MKKVTNTNTMYTWSIKYGKGKPNVNSETIKAKDYNKAFQYAADHAHGWGFEIKRVK